MMAAALAPSTAALILFGIFFTLMLLRVPVAFALGLACLPMFILEDRLDPVGGAVLPAHRQPDERRRHHRSAGAVFARAGGPLSR
jgi:hypothetical protein